MCGECEARREVLRKLWVDRSILAAVANLAKGAAEAIGIKPKTGVADLTKLNRAKSADNKDTGAAG